MSSFTVDFSPDHLLIPAPGTLIHNDCQLRQNQLLHDLPIYAVSTASIPAELQISFSRESLLPEEMTLGRCPPIRESPKSSPGQAGVEILQSA